MSQARMSGQPSIASTASSSKAPLSICTNNHGPTICGMQARHARSTHIRVLNHVPHLAAIPSTRATISSPQHPSPGGRWGRTGEHHTNVLEQVAKFSPRSRDGSGGGGWGGSYRGRSDGSGGMESPLVRGPPGVSRPTRGLGSAGPNPWQMGDDVDPVR